MLRNKTLFITGASRGIGHAIAMRAAADGANVVIAAKTTEPHPKLPGTIHTAAADIERAGGKALAIATDIRDEAQVEAAIAAAVERFGGIDILVNNAGIQHVAPVADFPPAKWDAIIAINLSSSFHTVRAALPAMKSRRWGRIVNIASAHALVASPFKSAYVAAKHGVAGFTKAVALETAKDGITVNCISPGYVWTTLVENQIPDTMKARGLTREQVMNDVLLAAQPTKRFVTPAEVASLALYLCSDGAASITGANLSMDGGWTAQ